MIANISPCGCHYEDTLNTLKYASRTKDLKTKIIRNSITVNKNDQLQQLKICQLQDEVHNLKE